MSLQLFEGGVCAACDALRCIRASGATEATCEALLDRWSATAIMVRLFSTSMRREVVETALRRTRLSQGA